MAEVYTVSISLLVIGILLMVFSVFFDRRKTRDYKRIVSKCKSNISKLESSRFNKSLENDKLVKQKLEEIRKFKEMVEIPKE